MKLSLEESLESHSRLREQPKAKQSDIVGWEVWLDGSLLWLEDGARLQMVAALNGAGLWLAGGMHDDILKQCLIRMLEASLVSRH